MLVQGVMNELNYEHWTDKAKYFYVYYIFIYTIYYVSIV